MEIEIKLGNRTYIFNSEADAQVAKDIYRSSMSNTKLEDLLDILRIDFSYAMQE